MLYDAHNHLHDARLFPYREEILEDMQELGIQKCVVNGTHPEDWDLVLELHAKYPDLIQPALGIHPWRVNSLDKEWELKFETYMKLHPYVCIGECGLDKWIEDYDLNKQLEVFQIQLAYASSSNLPISIHCIKAWQPLLDCLTKNTLPARGIHIHGFGGSQEVATSLLKHGAYFSFCGYFLRSNKAKLQKIYQALPENRILIETDAPDMLPPEHAIAHQLPETLNSPLNLDLIYSHFAQLRTIELSSFKKIIQTNFERFFKFTNA